MNADIKALIKSLPKIDLHCHLDGSLSPSFVADTLGNGMSCEELKHCMQAPATCKSLTEYLKCFDTPIKTLQAASNIKSAVLDVLKQAADEGVRYMEIRFAPAFSVNSSLTYNEVCEAAIEGCKEGLKAYKIHSNIILCAMRHLDLETNMKTVQAALEFLGNGVCALDLAGDESIYPNQNFISLFEYARRSKLPFTIHSGECGSSENIRVALELGAKRVGHGIALIKDRALIQKCADAGLGLELCPTSNFQTGAASDISAYPLKDFLNYGLLATINTDNRTVSNTTMTKELSFAYEKLEITPDNLKQIYENSIEISFADDNVKHRLYESMSGI